MINQDLPVKIYIIIDPEDGYVFYVGQTSGTLLSRLKAHMAEHRGTRHSSPMGKFIVRMKSEGRSPIIEQVTTCSMDDRYSCEEFWIKHYADQGFNLFNTYKAQIVQSRLRIKRA